MSKYLSPSRILEECEHFYLAGRSSSIEQEEKRDLEANLEVFLPNLQEGGASLHFHPDAPHQASPTLTEFISVLSLLRFNRDEEVDCVYVCE